jgi:hypothetical protein
MEDEVCTCGHEMTEHENGTGQCEAPACACPAYTEDVDDPATTTEEPSQRAAQVLCAPCVAT